MPSATQSAKSAAEAVDGHPGEREKRSALTAGLDVGTTSVKAVVADEQGRVVASQKIASGLVLGSGGKFEHDALATWWEAPRAALRSFAERFRLEAVAVSAMMPSVGAVDAVGRPLGPGLLYGDARAKTAARADGSRPPAQGAATLADREEPAPINEPTAGNEMAHLASWAARDRPDASGYWPAQAVANAALGGEGVVDLASAFAAGRLFNGSAWEPSVCQSAGLRAGQLPRVAGFGEQLGFVGPSVLGDRPELVLGAGSVDGLCELLVAGVVDDGDVLIALGSTLVVWLCVPGTQALPVASGLWAVPHLMAGKALLGGASNAGGMWVDWADRALRPQDLARTLRPSDIPLWWPWVNGERVPWHDPALRIGLAGADLSHGPGALRRAALEATGFVVRHMLEAASSAGTPARRFIVSGGGAASRDWLQAIADVLGHAVVPMAAPEGAALGAAFLARMAADLESSLDDANRWVKWAGSVEPRREWVEAAGERYERWSAQLPVRT